MRLRLKAPDSTIGEQLGQYYNGIVPVGYSRKNNLKYVGTGPFKVQSFTPGRQSVHVRNDNYWQSGQPYFDQVRIIDFADPSAQVNALFSGAIDAMTDIPFAQIETAKGRGIKVLESPGGGWLPLCMAIDMEPFTDVRVRQAMRLIADRPAMLAQVLSGHGRVGERPLRAVRRRTTAGAPAAPPGHRPGQVAAQGGRQGRARRRPAHDGRRGRHGRLRQRVRRAGQGGRRDDQRQGRPELLRRPVPQVAVLGRLLGHPQLPAAGRQRQPPDGALQRDATGRRRTPTSSASTGRRRRPSTRSSARSS